MFLVISKGKSLKTYINQEAFRLIEKRGKITPQGLSEALGIRPTSAASWLSKWATEGYLKHERGEGVVRTKRRGPGRPSGTGGYYVLGDRWWGDKVFTSETDPFV